jgi:hypothetical protein
MKKYATALAASLLMTAFAGTAQANIITNGGFESGATGWSCTGADSCNFFGAGVTGRGFQGFDNSGFGTLSQFIDTAVGTTYNFTFMSKTAFQLGGNQLGYGTTGLAHAAFAPATMHWAETKGSFVANSKKTAFQIYFATDPGTGTWLVDNVNVKAVPEPGTFALMGLSLLGLGFAARRRSGK